MVNRVFEHKNKVYPSSFTARYNLSKLVYFEEYNSIEDAIFREKQLKAGSRDKKVNLINNFNPTWIDRSDSLFASLRTRNE